MKICNVFWISANLVWKQKFGQNLPKIRNFSSLNQKMGLPKSCLNQTFYLLKFWEQWNSSLNRKTSLNRTCLNRKFTVFCFRKLLWLTVRKICSWDQEEPFEIFEITKTIYSNSERSQQFFSNMLLEFYIIINWNTFKVSIGANNLDLET